jgi:hypothetical protein
MDNCVRGIKEKHKIWERKHLTVLQMLNLILYGKTFMATFRKCYCLFGIRNQKNKANGGAATRR